MTHTQEPRSVWDRPVSDAELDQFYGVSPTQEEIGMAIGKAAAEFDDDDLGEVGTMAFEFIVGMRKQRIADNASRALYGKTGVIFARQVTV